MNMLKKFVLFLLTFSCLAVKATTDTTAKEEPAYEWRGCMIDVSRHFFSIEFLQRQVDVLSRMGINRLHLHLVDAGGWRMEIKAYPELTRRAAWRTESDWRKWWEGGMRTYSEETDPKAYGGYYTQEQLRNLVRYASDRGIIIVPEIEMPGHSEEVLELYPDLRCTPVVEVIEQENGHTYDDCLQAPERPNTGDYCPSNKQVEHFLKTVLDEVMDVFPSEYIHLGGDEAGKAAWSKCYTCQKRMEQLGTENVGELQADFMNRMIAYVNSKGRRAICWDEVIMDDTGNSQTAAKGNAVMVWRELKYAKKAIAKGYDVIMSPCSYCYLDYYQDAPPYQPLAAGGYVTLKKIYSLDPTEGLTPQEQKHVLGVQGNLWTEYIETESHAEYMLYPRMFAVAQVGLYGNNRKPWAKFLKQACSEVKRLKKKGYNPFDQANAFGERKESIEPHPHLAMGAKVTYAQPYNPKYPAAGVATLTDGWRGSWQHGDGRWQGFVTGNCLDFTIDMGAVRPITQISLDFMQNSSAWIYLPKTVSFQISTDGKEFRKILEEENPREVTGGVDFKKTLWQGSDKARFIRVTGTSTGEGEWIFTDEIVVE